MTVESYGPRRAQACTDHATVVATTILAIVADHIRLDADLHAAVATYLRDEIFTLIQQAIFDIRSTQGG